MTNDNPTPKFRGVRSRMPELNRPKAYLTYDDDETTHKLLLTERKNSGVNIKVHDKLYVFNRKLPVKIRQDLEERFGAVAVPNDAPRYAGTDRLFDTPGVATRAYTLKGERKLQVRIIGDTVDEVFRKISHVKTKMGEHGIREKMCAWDRIGHITVSDKDPRKKKIKPDFDNKTMSTIKQRDLAAYRDDYKDPGTGVSN